MKKNNIHIAIPFIVFFVLLLIQLSFVFLYHDDYGYASLSYIVNVDGVAGTAFGLTEVFNFLYQHYLEVNGRVLYFFLEIILLQLDINVFRIFQTVSVTLIFTLIYFIATRKTNLHHWLLALSTVCAYGLFGVKIASGGLYWFSASVAYVFSLGFFFCFIWFYDKARNATKYRFLYLASCAILLFISSFSQEVIAVAVVAYIGLLTLYEWFSSKKIDTVNIIMVFIALSGFLILILAPGNSVRMNYTENAGFYDMDLLQRIKNNIPYIIRGNFNRDNVLFTFVFLLFSLYCAYENLKIKKTHVWLHTLSFFSILMMILITAVQPFGYFEYVHENVQAYNYIFIIQLVLIFFSIFVYLKQKKEIQVMILLSSAFLSQLSLIMAPSDVHVRVHIVFQIIVFVFMITVLSHILKKQQGNKKMITYIVLSFCLLSAINFFEIMHGYSQNAATNKLNHKILMDSSLKIKKGDDVNEILLTKLPNDKYTDAQPYMPGCEYILHWMREYYDIPQNVKILYTNTFSTDLLDEN